VAGKGILARSWLHLACVGKYNLSPFEQVQTRRQPHAEEGTEFEVEDVQQTPEKRLQGRVPSVHAGGAGRTAILLMSCIALQSEPGADAGPVGSVSFAAQASHRCRPRRACLWAASEIALHQEHVTQTKSHASTGKKRHVALLPCAETKDVRSGAWEEDQYMQASA